MIFLKKNSTVRLKSNKIIVERPITRRSNRKEFAILGNKQRGGKYREKMVKKILSRHLSFFLASQQF